MSLIDNATKYFVAFILAVGVGVLGWQFVKPHDTHTGISAPIKLPDLSYTALAGKGAFDANCLACHGPNASGTDKGPPLVHDIYNPGHHADEAFYRAAQYGVRRHHWYFGDMPPQPQITRKEMSAIVRYVRELQAANGITYKPHRM